MKPIRLPWRLLIVRRADNSVLPRCTGCHFGEGLGERKHVVSVTFFIRVGLVVLIILILGVVERLRLSDSERVDFPGRPSGAAGLPFGKGFIFNSLVTSGWNTIRVADPLPLGALMA